MAIQHHYILVFGIIHNQIIHSPDDGLGNTDRLENQNQRPGPNKDQTTADILHRDKAHTIPLFSSSFVQTGLASWLSCPPILY